MNLANSITLLRIFLVPVVVWAIAAHEMWIACIGFVLAGISDGIDGFIARHYNQRTELGAYLDPIADKALLVSIYVTLGFMGHLPRWLVILVVFRDLLIVGGVVLAWLLERPMTIAPLIVSKANTAAQIILAGLILAALGFGFELGAVHTLGPAIVGTLTGLSALAYLAAWIRHMSGDGPGGTTPSSPNGLSP